jgi:hypothetical protein
VGGAHAPPGGTPPHPTYRPKVEVGY